MNSLPSLITVIIPCRNEASFIGPCLDSVLAGDVPADRLEIIVADGMSTDGTRETVARYCAKYPSIRLIDNPKFTVSPALNAGIRLAKGELIIRLDAHSQYPPSYIADCAALLEKTGAANAGGSVINVANGNNPWAEPIRFVTGHVFGVGNGACRTSDRAGFVDTVPFGTFRREIFQKAGFFDERLTRNQDNEFNARLIRAGYKIAFDPKIKIQYRNQASLSGLLFQAYYTGMWNVYTLRLCPYTFRWRRFIPPLFVLYLLLLPVAVKLGVIALLPLLLYLFLTVIFSASDNYPVPVKIRIAATFISYHLAYGAGTLCGGLFLLTGRWKSYLYKPLKS